MKNKFVLLFILSAVVLVTNSCSKADSVILSVTVDGTAYKIDGSSITNTTSPSGGNENYTFTITLGSVTLYMYLPNIKVGTYNFSTSYNPGPGFLLPGVNSETYISTKNNVPARGSIVISSISGTSVSGTFSGVLYPEVGTGGLIYTDSTTLNNGVFNGMQF